MTVTQVQTSGRQRDRLHLSALLPILALGILLALADPWVSRAATLAGLSIFVAMASIVLGRLRPFHPFATFGPANLVTLARGAIVAALFGLLLAPQALRDQSVAFVLAALALALDGVDGWLARRSGMVSRFGARFDMEIDALLILALSATAWLDGKAGLWVLSIGLMRYAFVAASYAVPALAGDLPPSQRRKLVCVLQMAVLGLLAIPAVAPPWSAGLALLCLLALAWSFLVDTLWLLRKGALT